MSTNLRFGASLLALLAASTTVKAQPIGSSLQSEFVIVTATRASDDPAAPDTAYDVDALCEKGKLIPPDWQKRLPDNSAPYTSIIVFVVRKGNPKGIKDWDDLVKPGVSRSSRPTPRPRAARDGTTSPPGAMR